jgi:hypothetical protein
MDINIWLGIPIYSELPTLLRTNHQRESFFQISIPRSLFRIMVKKGTATGGDGGSPFEIYRDTEPVKQLDVWYGKGSGPDVDKYTVLRGIRVWWAGGGRPAEAGYCPNDEKYDPMHTSFDFERNGNDPLDWMDIYGSTGRVDSLRLVTQDERDHFEAGGIGGTKCVQPAKGRKLHGFYGKAGGDIDKLGGVFSD